MDLLINKSEQPIRELFVDPPSIIFDYSLIRWCVPLAHQPPTVETRDVRCWGKVSRDEFRSALLSSNLCDPSACPDTAEECFDMYHQTLQLLTDKIVPIRHVTMKRQPIAAWMDHECHVLRRHSRMLERSYRLTKLQSNRISWVAHERKRHNIYRTKENAYWSLCLSEKVSQARKLKRAMPSILASTGKSSCDGIVPPSAHEFLNFFNEKVDAVRRETGSSPPESSLVQPAASFSEFGNYEAETIEKVIRTAPSKSSPLDPIPTNILKEFLPELLPYCSSRGCAICRYMKVAFQPANGHPSHKETKI